MARKSLLDIEWLKSQYHEDLNQLLQIYLKENDECMIILDEALHANDYKNVKAVSHKIKGSSRIIGAVSMEEMAEYIEYVPVDDEFTSHVSGMKAHYGKLRKEIVKLLDV